MCRDVDLLRGVAHRPPDRLVQQRVDVTDEPERPQQRRDEDDGARSNREHGDDRGRHGAERHERDRSFVGALLAGDDQRAEEHEAADERADGEQDDTEVEPGIRSERHVGGEHDARAPLQHNHVGDQCADEHEAEAGPGPFWPRDSAIQQYGRLEKDDPDKQYVEAVGRQREVKPVSRKQVHFGPARKCDEQAEQAADREEDDGRNRVGLDQLFSGEVDLETCRRAGAKFCVG